MRGSLNFENLKCERESGLRIYNANNAKEFWCFSNFEKKKKKKQIGGFQLHVTVGSHQLGLNLKFEF